MEHHPYITLNDNTEITYSDLKIKENHEEYVTIYFETPKEEIGFCSMDIDYPNGEPKNIVGYTKKEVEELLYHYRKIKDLVFEFAKER